MGQWWRGIGVGVAVRSVIRIGFGRHGKRGIHVHEVGREDLGRREKEREGCGYEGGLPFSVARVDMAGISRSLSLLSISV